MTDTLDRVITPTVQLIPAHWTDRRAFPEREYRDGRIIDLSQDQRARDLWALFQADACEHPTSVIVRRINSAENPFFSRYCADCGAKSSAMVPKVAAQREGIADTTEAEIEAVGERYLAARQSWMDRILDQAVERALVERDENDAAWQERYRDYLRSPQWKRRAAKIMERANGICEGCLTHDAVEVHHMTYEHVFNEFAFELRAMCAPCHRRFHGKGAA